jgi:aryl-alcohol dehydrogenase-like predicted oxidoreductase
MRTLPLPHSDLKVSRAIFGTSRLGGTVHRYDRKEALAILRMAAEAGINCFDTADLYGQGNSERLLAEAFRSRRDGVLIATKGGYVLTGKGKLLAKVKPLVRKLIGSRPGLAKAASRARAAQIRQDFSPRYLASALDASLRRLATDHIDIYQLHSPDSLTLDTDEVWSFLEGARQAGKIRAFGASALTWDDARLCLGRGASIVQVDACTFPTGGAAALAEECRAAGTLTVARQVFGLLRRPLESCGRSETAAGEAPLQVLQRHGEPHEVLQRYFYHHAPFDAFLLATTRLDHLKANLAALARPPLEAPDAAELRAALGHAPESPASSH